MRKGTVNARGIGLPRPAFFTLRLRAVVDFLENLYALLVTLHRVKYASPMEAA